MGYPGKSNGATHSVSKSEAAVSGANIEIFDKILKKS